ncbi:hypothetical protein PanWU01x14_050150, partial [Parasponia andersonii]
GESRPSKAENQSPLLQILPRCPYRKATVFQFSELCPEISARFRSFRYLGSALNSQFREFQRYNLYLWLDYKCSCIIRFDF